MLTLTLRLSPAQDLAVALADAGLLRGQTNRRDVSVGVFQVQTVDQLNHRYVVLRSDHIFECSMRQDLQQTSCIIRVIVRHPGRSSTSLAWTTNLPDSCGILRS